MTLTHSSTPYQIPSGAKKTKRTTKEGGDRFTHGISSLKRLLQTIVNTQTDTLAFGDAQDGFHQQVTEPLCRNMSALRNNFMQAIDRLQREKKLHEENGTLLANPHFRSRLPWERNPYPYKTNKLRNNKCSALHNGTCNNNGTDYHGYVCCSSCLRREDEKMILRKRQ
jgi:hypothetical protein